MSDIPFSEIQTLQPSAIVEMFILDCTSVGGSIFSFHAGTNKLNQNLIWQGQTYIKFPVEVSGFQYSGNGPLPRPTLRVSNILSAMSTLILQYSDLIGCKITRKRTLVKYLDAANFVSSINPTADPTTYFPDDVFYIDRKVMENKEIIEFELASQLDLAGLQLPKRQIIQNSCAWKYKGSECGYTGSNYFDINDSATTNPSKDSCSKRIEACKLRFGANAVLPFGGFPGAGLIGN